MRYSFNAYKLALNVRKHLVWFEEANLFKWEYSIITHDRRRLYPETRFQASSLIRDRIYVMVFCFRETSIRLISLRKANLREVKRYAKARALLRVSDT